jgi:hypothetical protein
MSRKCKWCGEEIEQLKGTPIWIHIKGGKRDFVACGKGVEFAEPEQIDHNLCERCHHTYAHHRQDDSCPWNWNESYPRHKFVDSGYVAEEGDRGFYRLPKRPYTP